MTTALILIAHGSRQTEANQDLHAMVESLRRVGRYPIVEPAFLELAEPNIEQAAQRCFEQGADRLILSPYFLSAGVHVQRDLAAQRDVVSRRHDVKAVLAAPIGRHIILTEILCERAIEAERLLDS